MLRQKRSNGRWMLDSKPLFTSDTHFGHYSIIKYANRPFKTLYEMNEGLIDRWNAKVKPEDHVFHLGDFAFCGVEEALKFRQQLNGNIHYLYGNHDKTARQMRSAWETVHDYVELEVHGYPMIVLSHYAFEVWNKSHHGSWHLYGHSHGTLPDNPNARKFDVGVDCWNYEPLTIDEVKAVMDKKKFVPIDHHGALQE